MKRWPSYLYYVKSVRSSISKIPNSRLSCLNHDPHPSPPSMPRPSPFPTRTLLSFSALTPQSETQTLYTGSCGRQHHDRDLVVASQPSERKAKTPAPPATTLSAATKWILKMPNHEMSYQMIFQDRMKLLVDACIAVVQIRFSCQKQKNMLSCDAARTSSMFLLAF